MTQTEISVTTPTPPPPKNGFGVTALVLGIVGFVTGLLPILGVVALACGLTGIGFSLGALRRLHLGTADNKAMTWIGAVLSVAAVIFGIIGLVILNNAVNDLNTQLNSAAMPILS